MPFPNLVQNRVRDAADQVGGDLQAVEIEQMRLNIAHRQPGGIEPDDLVIHAIDAGLAFLHQLRLKAAVAVAGHSHRQFAVLALQDLSRRAVAPVRLARRCFLAFLIAQMRGQLRAQHPLHEPDLQLLHQPGIAEQILRALNTLQQFIQRSCPGSGGNL